MATTREQVAAYDYESRRRVTSLVLGVDEAGRDPRRRLNRTLLGSAVLSVLVMAGFGIAGWLGGGRGPALPDSGAVLVSGTGNRYVVADGVLHPALNLASALLVGGGELTKVRPSALEGQQIGLPVGIPNAPDNLPDPDRLTRGPWTVCVVPSDSRVVLPTVEVLVGLPAPTQGVLSGSAAVVVEEGGASWLVTLGRRYQLTGSTRSILGLLPNEHVAVPGEVLDTIPEGPQIAIPQLDRAGAPQVAPPVRARLGDLIQTGGTGQNGRFFLVRRDGLSPVSAFVATLLQAGGSATVPGDPTAVFNAPPSREPVPGSAGWPEAVPEPVRPELGQPLCVSTTPGQPPGDAAWQATISLPAEMPQDVKPVTGRAGHLPGVATAVAIAPGTGALVLATTTSGQDGGYNLVTESGQRFPIASEEATRRLLFDPAAASRLPRPFVELLPSGPALDPQEASQEYTGSAPPPR